MIHRLRMKLKQRWLPSIYGRLLKGVLSLIWKTCRFEVEGQEHLKQFGGQEPCILAFWHQHLGMIPEILNALASQYQYAVMISNSRDGELISTAVSFYPQARSIRVPHNAKAAALKQMIRILKENPEVVVITPDGPKGPKHQVKPGIIFAAQLASAYVVPLSWKASLFFQLRTWDQMTFPKPFSTIRVKIGEPMKFQKKKSTEEDCAKLEYALNTLLD